MRKLSTMRSLAIALLASALCANAASAVERRTLTADDINALHELDDPQVSPDGEWVAYSVRTADLEGRQAHSDIWMTSWDGQESVRLTTSKSGAHAALEPGRQVPRVSLGRDDDNEPSQVWLLPRAGGEAEKLTGQGRRRGLRLVPGRQAARRSSSRTRIRDEPTTRSRRRTRRRSRSSSTATSSSSTRPATSARCRQHLYIFDIATRKAEVLTPGRFDEELPRVVARRQDDRVRVQARRGSGPHRQNWDLYAIERAARRDAAGADEVRRRSDNSARRARPAWSPDGKSIVYVQRRRRPKLIYYVDHRLAVVPATGGDADAS